jgi:hypothetical protein
VLTIHRLSSVGRAFIAVLVVACRADGDGEEQTPGANAFAGVAAADRAQADSLVAHIRRRVAEIERELPTYRGRTLELSGYSLEGGSLDAFGVEGVSRGGVRKLVATHYAETGRTVQTLYYGDFSPDSLIFATKLREYYDRPLSGKVTLREEEEFYFAQGSLLRWRDANGRVRGPTDVEARTRAAEIWRDSGDLMRCGTGPSDAGCHRSS